MTLFPHHWALITRRIRQRIVTVLYGLLIAGSMPIFSLLSLLGIAALSRRKRNRGFQHNSKHDCIAVRIKHKTMLLSHVNCKWCVSLLLHYLPQENLINYSIPQIACFSSKSRGVELKMRESASFIFFC